MTTYRLTGYANVLRDDPQDLGTVMYMGTSSSKAYIIAERRRYAFGQLILAYRHAHWKKGEWSYAEHWPKEATS